MDITPDFIPLFQKCGQAVALALSNYTADWNASTGQRGAGGDETLVIDRLAETAARDFVGESGISVNIYSEEAGFIDRGAEITLIIDPIDQTINARRGLPFYTFSIAAYQAGQVMAGLVRYLAGQDTFHATRGGGAFRNGKPIRVSTCRHLSDASCSVIRASPGETRPEHHRLFFETHLLRVTGCSSLDLCYVASGSLDACVHADLRSGHGERDVDVAAAMLIVKEAGGVMLDVYGNEFQIMFDPSAKRSIMAAATPELMTEIFEILHKHE